MCDHGTTRFLRRFFLDSKTNHFSHIFDVKFTLGIARNRSHRSFDIYLTLIRDHCCCSSRVSVGRVCPAHDDQYILIDREYKKKYRTHRTIHFMIRFDRRFETMISICIENKEQTRSSSSQIYVFFSFFKTHKMIENTKI